MTYWRSTLTYVLIIYVQEFSQSHFNIMWPVTWLKPPVGEALYKPHLLTSALKKLAKALIHQAVHSIKLCIEQLYCYINNKKILTEKHAWKGKKIILTDVYFRLSSNSDFYFFENEIVDEYPHFNN